LAHACLIAAYANEISRDRVGQIEKQKRARSAANLTVILGGEDDPRLPMNALDPAIMVRTDLIAR